MIYIRFLIGLFISGKKFAFSTQGQWVAVFYDGMNGPNYFIGQVFDVTDSKHGTISFLRQTK